MELLVCIFSTFGMAVFIGYIQKHYECLFEPCNLLIANTIRNVLFLSSNKTVT